MLAGGVVVVGFELFCRKVTSTHMPSHIFVYVELNTEEKLTSSPLTLGMKKKKKTPV